MSVVRIRAETGIPVYQWDVADIDACAAGIKKVETTLSPIDILVNNAGIVRDSSLYNMTREQREAVPNDALSKALLS